MIKVFTTNKDGKIELTKEELQNLLDTAYWEGYRESNTYVYNTPHYTFTTHDMQIDNKDSITLKTCT